MLQSDLDKLEKWETSWLMAFHPEKCNVLTINKEKKSNKVQKTIKKLQHPGIQHTVRLKTSLAAY
jgi:pentose-5-phosphate-3-epimerase